MAAWPPERAPDVTDDTLPDPELDQVMRAAGRRPLREVSRRPGDPEIRLAMHGGIAVPNHALLLRRRGTRVAGEVWLWWGPLYDSQVAEYGAAWPRHAGEFGCPAARWAWETALVDGERERTATLVCRGTLKPAPDWAALWRRLDSLAAWTLPDETELPSARRIVSDGVILTIELFDGTRYRRVQHGNPDARTSPEAARAVAVLRAASSVLKALQYEERPERR